MTFNPDAPLERLVGKRTADGLGTLGLTTAGSLLRHYPRRYAEPGELTDLGSLENGAHVTVMARIVSTTVRQMRARHGALLETRVTDGSRELSLTFFGKSSGFLRSHESRLVPGRTGLFSGTVQLYRGAPQLTHPDYWFLDEDEESAEEAFERTARPSPIYPASTRIASWKVANAVGVVLGPLTAADLPDPVPADLLARHGYPSLFDSLTSIHAPATVADAHKARARLRYEEALVLQAELVRRRALTVDLPARARPRSSGGTLLADFDAALPFALTAGQRAVGEEIAADLERPHPMQRLLQGDVGSGKTIVALRAMLQVVDAGGQAALLAPTEVLAAQHARTITAMLGPLAHEGMLGGADHATRVTLLTGSLGAAARKEALLDAASGRAGIVVGTHALLGEKVQFADLGLVVVDEQHRFGVEQRDALRNRAEIAPHMLVMTATPIPRTVAMTVFGDLEVSTLTEVPAGRTPVTTHVALADRPRWMARVWQIVRERLDAGELAYVVCPRIDPDDANPADDDGGEPMVTDESAGTRPPLRAVLEVAEQLAAEPALRGAAIGVMHGRLAPSDKDRVMTDFTHGRSPVLVSTTVIEVGVDVPAATVMVIFDADRFGISQLHQLRGRVGRGNRPGTCFLVTSAEEGTASFERLTRLAATTDGFELAQLDLETRSEGDVLGASQSGRGTSLRLLRVVRDADVIARARADAEELVGEDPTLETWPGLAAAVRARLAEVDPEFLERA